MPREVIRFNGQPVQVRLDQAPAAIEPRENDNGVYYQYVTDHNARIMFLKPEAHSQLIKLGAQAGENISIQRIRRGRSWGWDVRRVSEQQQLPVGDPAKTATAASSPPTAPTQAPTAFSSFAGALKVAMDACIEAQHYARSKGSSLQFQSADICAIACTLYSKEVR